MWMSCVENKEKYFINQHLFALWYFEMQLPYIVTLFYTVTELMSQFNSNIYNDIIIKLIQ